MSAVAVDQVPRGTPDTFGGLLRDGETPEEALRRLEKTKGYTKTIGTDEGQRLLAAATGQVTAIPNGGVAKRRRSIAPVPATATNIDREPAVILDDSFGTPPTRTPPGSKDVTPRVIAEAPPTPEHFKPGDVTGTRLLDLDLSLLDVGENVRVDPGELAELAASIAKLGVLQPIRAVGPHADGRYRAVWGQRRILASLEAGKDTIPALVEPAGHAVDDVGPRRSIEQLVENLQRADLAPLDRARAMRAVVDAGMSQVDLARELGLAASTIANDLGLLEAPAAIQKAIAAGELTPSHAKAMKGLAPKTQQELARDAIANGYSAHRLEHEVQRRKQRAEREAEQERQSAEATKKNLADLKAAIAELATRKKPGLGTEIVVFDDYYDGNHGQKKQLAAALTAAGFTNVRIQAKHGEAEARPKGCTCTSWRARLTSTYSYPAKGYVTRLSATPACIVPKHRQDKAAADRQAEAAKDALRHGVRDHVRQTATARVVPETGAIAIDRILAEAILWDALSYTLPDWAARRGGTRTKPWAVLHALTDEELAAELQQRVAGDFRDKAGYHVDWPALADELGITTDPAAAAADS